MDSIVFPPYPILVVTPLGDGYIMYIKANGMYENDDYTVVLLDGGDIRHFLSNQIKVHSNAQYEIIKHTNNDKQNS